MMIRPSCGTNERATSCSGAIVCGILLAVPEAPSAALPAAAASGAFRCLGGITERNLNIQPTITIRPGWPLRIIVNKDLVLRPYRDLGVIR